MTDIQARYRRLTELIDSLPANDRIRQEATAALAEIAQLRTDLGIFAFEENWKELSVGNSHEGWIWDHDGTSGRPFLFARQTLEKTAQGRSPQHQETRDQ